MLRSQITAAVSVWVIEKGEQGCSLPGLLRGAKKGCHSRVFEDSMVILYAVAE